MKKYEFLEHTADAKFRAYGKTLEEQFSNAAKAMISIMINPEKINAKTKKKIKIEGKDKKALLYNFLEEFLFLLDVDNFLLKEITKIKIKKLKQKLPYKLEAEAAGDKAANYETHGDVKAVTYNDMETKKGYVQVVVDI